MKYSPRGFAKTEGDAMRLVRDRAPAIPVPELIHFWVDEEWERYFLIQRRIRGETLDRAWWKLTEEEKRGVAKEIAFAIVTMAAITAPRYQGPDGKAFACDWFRCREPDEEVWGPRLSDYPGPFTAEEFREYLRRSSDGVEPPEIGSEFHFYHSDLGPANIILAGMETAEDGGSNEDRKKERHVSVAAILDWETAGFHPKFWIAFFVVSSFKAFNLSIEEGMDMAAQDEYESYLFDALEDVGIRDGWTVGAWYDQFREGQGKVLSRKFLAMKRERAPKRLQAEK